MHPLQNGSQVTERPANKPVSGLPGYFTESGENNVPSYPGQDWFNDVIDEFLSLLSQFDINLEQNKHDHLSKAVQASVNTSQSQILTGCIYPPVGVLEIGDNVPSGISYLRVSVNGKPTVVSFYPSSEGEVKSLSNTQAVIGTSTVDFKLSISNGVEFSSVHSLKNLEPSALNTVLVENLDDYDVVVSTRSYYENLAPFLLSEGRGSGEYLLTTISKARNIVGDQQWEPDGFRDHYLSDGSNQYVALLLLNFGSEINAEQFGASPYVTAEVNDAAILSAINACKTVISFDYKSIVILGRGSYSIDKPIVLQPDSGTSQRLVGFKGLGVGCTEIVKTTTTTSGIANHDVDACIVEVPADGEQYAFFGDSGGFSLRGTIDGEGFGFYAVNCPASKRENIYSTGRLKNFFQDDCWMSAVDRIWSLGAFDTGITITGGTSVVGGNLYSDGSKLKGFNFRGLTYSHLHCSCDKTAQNEATSGLAYDFELSKGLSGQFNVEKCHGVEFKFQNTDGLVLSGGRSYHSSPASSLTSKITCVSSTVKFVGFDWTNSISNLTEPQKQNYDLITKDALSSVDFDSCVFSEDLDERFVRQLDFKFAGNVSSQPYTNKNGVTIHTIALDNSKFKRLCYVGNVGRFKIDVALCVHYVNVDAMYLPIDDKGLYAPDISQSAASPDDIMQWYENGNVSIATLQGFVQDGWLYVRPSNAGNNRPYHFKVFTPVLF